MAPEMPLCFPIASKMALSFSMAPEMSLSFPMVPRDGAKVTHGPQGAPGPKENAKQHLCPQGDAKQPYGSREGAELP